MNDYRPPLRREEEPDYTPEPLGRSPAPPQPSKGGGWMGKLSLLLSVLALAVSVAALVRANAGLPGETEAPPEPVTFVYRDRILEAEEGIPVNAYDPNGFYTDERGRVHYAQNGQEARTGIDVSFYQKDIDWPAVAADGIDFAILRLGYRGYTAGGLMMDERFYENMEGALAAGLEVGVYFFSQALDPREAEAEAAYVLDAVSDYPVTGPIVFDWEFITPGSGARTDGMDGALLSQCAAAFCEKVSQAGYEPFVYFNQDLAYLTYDLSQIAAFPFWLAEYDTAPDFYYGFDLWQYSSTGQVAGIQGSVDLNLDFRPLKG